MFVPRKRCAPERGFGKLGSEPTFRYSVLPLVYAEPKVTSVKHTAAGTGKGTGKGTQCMRARETTKGVWNGGGREEGIFISTMRVCHCRHTDVCVCLPNMFAADYSDEFWQAKGTTPVDLVHKDT